MSVREKSVITRRDNQSVIHGSEYNETMSVYERTKSVASGASRSIYTKLSTTS